MPNYRISQLCGGGEILVNLAIANALPTNTFPLSLICSIDACFYNLVLERELELSDCLPARFGDN